MSIDKLDGRVVAAREDPPSSFTGHTLETPWDPLDRAYFNGYALWIYLTTPFRAGGASLVCPHCDRLVGDMLRVLAQVTSASV